MKVSVLHTLLLDSALSYSAARQMTVDRLHQEPACTRKGLCFQSQGPDRSKRDVPPVSQAERQWRCRDWTRPSIHSICVSIVTPSKRRSASPRRFEVEDLASPSLTAQRYHLLGADCRHTEVIHFDALSSNRQAGTRCRRRSGPGDSAGLVQTGARLPYHYDLAWDSHKHQPRNSDCRRCRNRRTAGSRSRPIAIP